MELHFSNISKKAQSPMGGLCLGSYIQLEANHL